MPDLHGWITQQVAEVEDIARLTSGGGYEPDTWHAEPSRSGRWVQIVAHSRTLGEPPEADQPVALVQSGRREHLLIARHDPAAVLRRCEADRRVLERHRMNPGAIWYEAAMCHGCGTEDEMACPRTENLNDCPELLDLGYAHGLTDEILATLDRPREGERPEPAGLSLIPDAVAEAMYGCLLAAFIGTRPVEPRPEVKAMEILSPELKTIPGYIPTTEEQP